MNRRTRQSGFALLMAMVLVFIAGVAMAGLARRSAAGAVESLSAVQDLQRRWAVASCRATLLDRAEVILDRAERDIEVDAQDRKNADEPVIIQPVASLRLVCQLAGTDYELVLVDEQSKVNVNRLLSQSGRSKAQAAVRLLSSRSNHRDGGAGSVMLRPLPARPELQSASLAMSALATYSQLFSDVQPRQLAGTNGEPGMAAEVTCWGNGKVHVRRASDAVIELACGGALEPQLIRSLIALRKEHPDRDLAGLLSDLEQVDEKKKAKIPDLLTDSSGCHALWVIAHGRQRSWFTLAVGVGNGGSPAGESKVQRVPVRYDFTW